MGESKFENNGNFLNTPRMYSLLYINLMSIILCEINLIFCCYFVHFAIKIFIILKIIIYSYKQKYTCKHLKKFIRVVIVYRKWYMRPRNDTFSLKAWQLLIIYVSIVFCVRLYRSFVRSFLGKISNKIDTIRVKIIYK